MRILISLGLVAAFSLLGYAKSYALTARLEALRAFEEECTQLLLLMDYKLLPLDRLVESMETKTTVLAPFWQAFKQALPASQRCV